MNIACSIKPLGDIDEEAGEFWVDNPFRMMAGKENLSAYESNQLFLSHYGQRFINLSHESGANIDSDSRSAIAADFDRDGAIDILVANVGGGPLRLFGNRIPSKNHRVRIDLAGVASNRSALGTRVVAECGDRRIVRDHFAVNGFMGQSPSELLLGVGAAEKIDRLTIRWPTGDVQTFIDVPVDCTISVTEGKQNYNVNRSDWLPTRFP